MSRFGTSMLVALFALIAMTGPLGAQRIASGLSANIVSVDSSFSGETLTIFGNIEPEFGEDSPVTQEGYHVIILVQGPALDRVARKKTGDLGIWLNTEQVLFQDFPSYFWVLSSSKLDRIATDEILEQEGLLPRALPGHLIASGNGDRHEMGAQLVRLMEEAGLYGIQENGVLFRSRTLFSASLSLPANVPNGDFLAQSFLLKDGAVVAKRTQGFAVRKTGFELLVGTTAKTNPLLYGVICVVLAVFSGWLGGVAFRR